MTKQIYDMEQEVEWIEANMITEDMTLLYVKIYKIKILI